MGTDKEFDATEHFGDRHAAIYDDKIRTVIRGYEEMHDLAYYLLKDSLPAAASVLISGLGTGHEAVTYAGNEKGWLITGVDPTAEMVKSAQARIHEMGLDDRVDAIQGTVADLDQTGFDAATSILVMQFLKDNGDKEGYLQAIAQRLKSGGRMILIDLEGDRRSPCFQSLMSGWRCHQFASRDDDEQVVKDFGHVDRDVQFVDEKRIRQLLTAAGFTDICKFYQSYLFGGYLAVRASGKR